MRLRKQFIILLLVIIASSSVNAHHGFGVHYDISQQIKIEGVLERADLRNPHSFLEVMVESEDGAPTLWSCETQARSVMQRKGIDIEQFVVGQKIIVRGSAARSNENHCEIGSVLFADGNTLVFRSVEGHANIGKYEAPDDENTSIFATWIRDSFNGVPFEPGVAEAITEAGKIANADYDATKDDPSNFCVAANPVRAWIAPGTPTKITRDADVVRIDHEFMDTTRSIFLDADPQSRANSAPDDHSVNLLGYSYGKIDDGQLTVYSVGFSSGVFLTHFQGSGVKFSNQLRLIERFSIDAETNKLDYQWQAFDDEYFPSGIRGSLTGLSRVDMEIGRYDCVLD